MAVRPRTYCVGWHSHRRVSTPTVAGNGPMRLKTACARMSRTPPMGLRSSRDYDTRSTDGHLPPSYGRRRPCVS